jgi:hypothetical protein
MNLTLAARMTLVQELAIRERNNAERRSPNSVEPAFDGASCSVSFVPLNAMGWQVAVSWRFLLEIQAIVKRILKIPQHFCANDTGVWANELFEMANHITVGAPLSESTDLQILGAPCAPTSEIVCAVVGGKAFVHQQVPFASREWASTQYLV